MDHRAPSMSGKIDFAARRSQSDLNSPARSRQRAVFDRVGAQLVDRHGKGDGSGSGSLNVRALYDKPARCFAIEWRDGLAQDFSQLGGFPVGLQEEIMRAP